MRALALTCLLTAALAADGADLSAQSRAQGLPAVMAAIQNGGGWVTLPIVAGRGSASTVTIPSMGMSLSGCVQVWEGHSGEWSITATENVAEEQLEVSAMPGRGVPFTHSFGLRAQLDLTVEWSEPRDTTLWLWVGLDRARDDTDQPCTPKS